MAQKGSKDIVKIVHVTVFQLQFMKLLNDFIQRFVSCEWRGDGYFLAVILVLCAQKVFS